MTLKKEVIKKIRANLKLKKALWDYFNIAPSTLYNWLANNSPRFTEWGSLQVIAAYLKTEPESLITESDKVQNEI